MPACRVLPPPSRYPWEPLRCVYARRRWDVSLLGRHCTVVGFYSFVIAFGSLRRENRTPANRTDSPAPSSVTSQVRSSERFNWPTVAPIRVPVRVRRSQRFLAGAFTAAFAGAVGVRTESFDLNPSGFYNEFGATVMFHTYTTALYVYTYACNLVHKAARKVKKDRKRAPNRTRRRFRAK